MTGKQDEQVSGRVADSLVEGLPWVILRSILDDSDIEFTRDFQGFVGALIIYEDHFKIIELLAENRLQA